jgi:hypothetical protein
VQPTPARANTNPNPQKERIAPMITVTFFELGNPNPFDIEYTETAGDFCLAYIAMLEHLQEKEKKDNFCMITYSNNSSHLITDPAQILG